MSIEDLYKTKRFLLYDVFYKDRKIVLNNPISVKIAYREGVFYLEHKDSEITISAKNLQEGLNLFQEKFYFLFKTVEKCKENSRVIKKLKKFFEKTVVCEKLTAEKNETTQSHHNIKKSESEEQSLSEEEYKTIFKS